MRHHATVERNDSVRTEASFKLLEENISLIDRLRAKGEIVKYEKPFFFLLHIVHNLSKIFGDWPRYFVIDCRFFLKNSYLIYKPTI